jgi:hypothetical protein
VIFTCEKCGSRTATASIHDSTIDRLDCPVCGEGMHAPSSGDPGHASPSCSACSDSDVLAGLDAETRAELLEMATRDRIAAVRRLMSLARCGIAEAKECFDRRTTET